MDEQTAKKKWCPMVRRSSGGFNRTDTEITPLGTNCIASECMLWLYEYKMDRSNGAVVPDFVPLEKINDGYCGLAGKP